MDDYTLLTVASVVSVAVLIALEWQYRRWERNLTAVFKFVDDMKVKDPELYDRVKNLSVVDAVEIWNKTYPEDFPNRELKVILYD